MKASILRDERGVAMVFEIALVAVVLGLVGFAMYQASNHNSPTASVVSQPATPAPNSAAGLAASAAAITEADSVSDVNASAAADNIAAEVVAADADVSNLGGVSNVSSF